MLCGHVTKVLLLFTDVPERCLSAFFGYLSIGDVSRLGAFAMRLLLLLSACVDGFPVLRLLRPIRHFPRASGVSRDVALSLRPTTLIIPRKASCVRMVRLKQDGLGGVFYWSLPLSAAPQDRQRVKQVDLCPLRQGRHGSLAAGSLSQQFSLCRALLADISGKVCQGRLSP